MTCKKQLCECDNCLLLNAINTSDKHLCVVIKNKRVEIFFGKMKPHDAIIMLEDILVILEQSLIPPVGGIH